MERIAGRKYVLGMLMARALMLSGVLMGIRSCPVANEGIYSDTLNGLTLYTPPQATTVYGPQHDSSIISGGLPVSVLSVITPSAGTTSSVW